MRMKARVPINEKGLCRCGCPEGACEHAWTRPATVVGIDADGRQHGPEETVMCSKCGMFKWDHDDFLVPYRKAGIVAAPLTTPERPKIVVLCGSTRFVDIMAVVGWIIERDEGAIVMGLHLLPAWYPDCPGDHAGEAEGVKEQFAELHLRKIDMADEVFVVNYQDYLGESTQNEVNYARQRHIPLRWFSHDVVGHRVLALMPGKEKS